MKIICTVDEFARMVRRCNSGSCYNCAFGDICGDTLGIEQFVSAENVIDPPLITFRSKEEGAEHV